MQAKIRDSLHKITPHRGGPARDTVSAEEAERVRHAQERYVMSLLYPAYGFVYSLARRESVVYPVLVRLFQFTLLSTLLSVCALAFLTPVSLTVLRCASLHVLPAWLLFGPALALSVVIAAFLVAVCIHKFKHEVDSIIAVEVAHHEGVAIERKVVQAGPRPLITVLIWIVTFPLNFIPLIGIPLFFWVHGLTKAYSFSKARIVVENDWTKQEKNAFIWKGIFKLQFLGFWVAVLEVIPIIGPIFHFTNLVAKALYVADGLKIGATHP
eukprot:Gregarina_sp_Pseudo_9__2296@NODE_2617_length_935_cov_2_595982_g2400_i0_p1_GENE_NODE_2617_length_935_cov_2_595982_g2400_i0NODE_2617_length_935_cov_2_595982_g2400_i0_p1_ORF_typecomplete_len268_score71_05EI24/PF07264_11/8_7e16EOS1/PF12326_8/0_0085DUF4714/PF15833_5/0_082Arteri_Gl/PF00951_18/0_1_NODE_2617_length_935_cov_2_595982_g2400_i038841